MKLKVFYIIRIIVVICIALVLPVLTGQAQATRQKAAQLTITDAAGRHTIVTRQQGKVVFLNFWALTCAPCKAELPTINVLARRYQGDSSVLILPIDVDHDFAGSMRYFSENGFALGVYAPVGVVPQALFAGVLPTTVVIDRQGHVAYMQQGEARYDSPSFLHLIDSLVNHKIE